MCWSVSATIGAVALGAAATALTVRRGDPPAVPIALGYFTAIEAVQLASFTVLSVCGHPLNQALTLLAFLHIAFQPLVLNALALELVAAGTKARVRSWVLGMAGLATAVMLVQLYPFAWAGACQPGSALCGPVLCTVPGEWHIAWQVPYNGLLVPVDRALGTWFGLPTYVAAFFLLPLAYGAWRFALFHLLAGPVLVSFVFTRDPNEMPAIWCLFSVGLMLISLSPWLRARVSLPGGWGRQAVPA